MVSLSNRFGFEFCDLEFICDLSFVIWDLKNFFLEKEELFINPNQRRVVFNVEQQAPAVPRVPCPAERIRFHARYIAIFSWG